MTQPPVGMPAVTSTEWQKLDPRSLLIGPLGAVKDFLVPMMMALFGATASDSSPWWFGLFAIALPGIVGVFPWLTTRYRITERNLEVRSRFIGTSLKTAPLDRIRTVDTESSLLHRLFGVTKVAIGTGTDDGQIKLNALDAQAAAALREQLLHRSPAAQLAPSAGAADADPSTLPAPDPTTLVPPPTETLATLDWRWARFAPFSLSRMVIAVTALGALAQFGDRIPLWDLAHSAWRQVAGTSLAVVALWMIATALVLWTIFSIGGYLLQWFGFRLWRADGSLHLASGLVTTKSVSVEEKRVRGVVLSEPLLLRLVGGAELAVMSTGSSHGTTAVLPPAPLAITVEVADRVIGQSGPLAVELTKHGWFSRRRLHVHAQWDTIGVALLFAAWWWFEWPTALTQPWIALATVAVLAALGAVAAEATYRHRGYGLTGAFDDGYLIRGNGVTTRRRTVLERDGIVGWVIQESWFQRRLGLCTLVATTAAGEERVEFTDIPRAAAVQLADRATPAIFDEFRAVEPSQLG